MRDIIIVLGVLFLCVLIMRRAWLGVLVWTWIALLNPHKEAYGFSVDLRLNLLVVLVTLGAVILNREPKQWPGGKLPWLFVVFILWTTVATAISPDPEESFIFWNDFVIKMALHMVLVMLVINSKHRLTALVWTVAISLGYHATKLAIKTAASGLTIEGLAGAFGPNDTMIMDRNHFALAMLMLCPLLLFLSRQAKAGWVRVCCLLGVGAALLSVVGSQSRGGFATMVVMLGYIWLKSNRKILFGGVLASLAALGIAFGPQEIRDRLATILDQVEEVDLGDEREYDESFCLRLAVWQIGYDMTLANPVFGNGLRSIQNVEVASDYESENHICADSPKYGPRAAHNIYIEVMTDSGFVGLGLFLTILIGAWLSLGRTIWRARGRNDLAWARDLASMLQVSIVGYAVGGVLLSMAYYDGYFLLVAMAAILARLVDERTRPIPPRRPVSLPAAERPTLEPQRKPGRRRGRQTPTPA